MIAHGTEIKIFTGNAHKNLAENICQSMGIKLGDATVDHFADGEVTVSLYETVRGADVFLVQPTCTPVNEHLMELLIMIDACSRASAGRITAVIPYFGYARQDRKAKPRDPISSKLVANLIAKAGADRIMTMDLHAPQIQGFFDIPVDHLVGAPLFAEYILKEFAEEGLGNVVAVSPDVGSVARTRSFAHRLGIPLAIVDKRRPQANESEVMNIIGEVADKNVILFDDMVDTAGSLCAAARALVEIGGAKNIYACATHGVLSGKAIERISKSVIKQVVLLNTVPYPEDKPACDKIKYISVAPMFAEAIDRVYEEVSISTLFK
ncbi:MAG: ribose-phosphate pyrophosphokinase [Oscillospiraceae bacterium]|nr:ribose-phosphate pyrophosphokinase [Oscillospiraceae bacterium]